MSKEEELNDIVYECEGIPPYDWKVIAKGENGNGLVLERGQGSWVTAMFKAQELKKMLVVPKKENENG